MDYKLRILPVNMTLEDTIWIATAIDCEGCICLGKCTRKRTRADGSIAVDVSYHPNITIVNTNLEFLAKCKRIMCSMEAICNRSERFAKKPVYRIFLRNREQILLLLKAIEPHMICKREITRRLIVWLEWFKTKRVVGAKRLARRGVPEAERVAIRAEYDRMATFTREVQPFYSKSQPN